MADTESDLRDLVPYWLLLGGDVCLTIREGVSSVTRFRTERFVLSGVCQ